MIGMKAITLKGNHKVKYVTTSRGVGRSRLKLVLSCEGRNILVLYTAKRIVFEITL